jgi:hypothetical protein
VTPEEIERENNPRDSGTGELSPDRREFPDCSTRGEGVSVGIGFLSFGWRGRMHAKDGGCPKGVKEKVCERLGSERD